MDELVNQNPEIKVVISIVNGNVEAVRVEKDKNSVVFNSLKVEVNGTVFFRVEKIDKVLFFVNDFIKIVSIVVYNKEVDNNLKVTSKVSRDKVNVVENFLQKL